MDRAELEIFHQGLRHATATRTGDALDGALVDLGWHDAVAADPRPGVSLLFECQGAANATSSAIDDLLLVAFGLESGQARAVVVPSPDRWDPPGEIHGESLSVRGLGTARLRRCDTAVVVARTADCDVAVEMKVTELALVTVRGMDPWMGLAEITGVAGRDSEEYPLGAGTWAAAIGLAQLAISHELVGAAGAMLELARAHALERIQFGQPISSFQAVRHRLAESLVAIETARAALAAAWEDRSPQAPAIVKALAGRSARTVARHCQQVLAGMGFTTEHPLHRYIRRVLVLDELFGSSRSLTQAIGGDAVAGRCLPALLPL